MKIKDYLVNSLFEDSKNRPTLLSRFISVVIIASIILLVVETETEFVASYSGVFLSLEIFFGLIKGALQP